MCRANYINGCEKLGTFEGIDFFKGRVNRFGEFCSKECANEHAGEISEGTVVLFWDALNAPTQEQYQNNRDEVNYRYRDA